MPESLEARESALETGTAPCLEQWEIVAEVLEVGATQGGETVRAPPGRGRRHRRFVPPISRVAYHGGSELSSKESAGAHSARHAGRPAAGA